MSEQFTEGKQSRYTFSVKDPQYLDPREQICMIFQIVKPLHKNGP